MKKFILIFSLLLFMRFSYAQDCDFCDHVIEPAEFGIIFKAGTKNVQPGDTICMKSGVYHEYMAFYDLAGTKENPVVIINCGGLVQINSTKRGFDTFNSHDFVITGTGDSSIFYGFSISGGSDGIRCNSFSNNYIIDHVAIDNVTNHGFDLKNDPVCSDQRTWRSSGLVNDFIIVHDTKLTNIGREGFYVGDSHYETSVNCLYGDNENPSQLVEEAPIILCEIYNNLVLGTGNDGIQVGSVVGKALIHDNIIDGYGLGDLTHRSGFQINPGTKANIYQNKVFNGLGSSFFIKGDGVTISNNEVNTAKNAVESYDNLTSPNSRYDIYNNSFLNLQVSGIAMICADFTRNQNIFYNNIVHLKDETAKPWGYQKTSAFADANNQNNLFNTNLAFFGFVDPENGNLNLKSTSIAVDAGDCSIFGGASCDIGAEYAKASITYSKNTIEFKNKSTDNAPIEIQEYTVMGENLRFPLYIKKPANFKLSLDGVHFSTDENLLITHGDFRDLNIKLYVALESQASGEISDTLFHTSYEIVDAPILIAKTAAVLSTTDPLKTSLNKIYPNPVKIDQSFNVELSIKPTKIATLVFFDSVGKAIYSMTTMDQKFTIELPSSLKSGVYFVNFKIDNQSYHTQKLIRTN